VSERGGSITDLGRLWRTAAPAQRIGIGAFIVICAGLLAVVSGLARKPSYGVLYANLEQEDAAAVVQRLRDLKTPYRVTGAGTVEAPTDSIYELRLDLAADGIPAGGQTGFELFDRTRFGLTDFGERLNFQRALQGELARTIAHLDAVEQARVHLALPAERLYSDAQEKPTASVVLRLRGAQALNGSQVRSIVHLVSGAVEGLSPESVAIMDTRGRLLSSPDDSGAGGIGLGAASDQIQLRREYEHEIEAAVQSMLDGIIGPGKAMVRASAEMSFDRVERERETYEPASSDTGVLASRQENRETYSGLSQAPAAGVPGVSANTGTAATVGSRLKPSTRPAGKLAVPGADQYDHSEVQSQYLVSRQRETTTQPPGQIKKVSLSVFIDEKADLGKVDDLRGAVSAAAGLDSNRGDSIVITRIPFTPPAPEEKGGQMYAIRDFYFRVGRDFAAIVLAALFLHFVGGALRRSRGSDPMLPAPTPAPVATGPTAAAPAPAPQFDAQIDPDRAAAVLRTWLSADEQAGDNGRTTEAGPPSSG
jgi:flagellar M-ring protein FliF